MTETKTRTASRPDRTRTVIAVVTAALLVLVGMLTPSATMADGNGPALTLSISEVDLEGPAISDITVTVTNVGGAAVTDVIVEVGGPINWTLYPATHTIEELADGASVEVVTEIHVPNNPSPTTLRKFTASATYLTSAGARESVDTIRLQQLELGETGTMAELRNNVGTTTLETVAAGDYDGDGNSFSRELLAELGATPGATVEHLGATFTWPDVAPGEPDNVVAAGQSVELEGSGGGLAVLGSGLGSGVSGQFVIHYSDGSASTGNLGFGNWFSATPAFGETVAYKMNGRNTPAGLANTEYEYGIYVSTINIDPRKTVSAVTLPNAEGLHIFAMGFAPYVPGPEPTAEPTGEPTEEPTGGPTDDPSGEPSDPPATQQPSKSPSAAPGKPTLPPGTDLYTTPGKHHVGGRDWFTKCEAYSQTFRCQTDIWATTVLRDGAGYEQVTGWVFNNLTYLPMMTRVQWSDNPLGYKTAWTAADGRKWYTDCDSSVTGRNGCRSYVWANLVEVVKDANGATSYRTVHKWVFNNMVRFK